MPCPTWLQRDSRLLIPWMRDFAGRKRIINALSGKQYRSLVRIVPKLPFPDYMDLISQHRSVLSPPGKGYDCTRTWESISVGSSPWLLKDTQFDQRIYEAARVNYMPPPDALSPEMLEKLLGQVQEPGDTSQLNIHHWSSIWALHLKGAAQKASS